MANSGHLEVEKLTEIGNGIGRTGQELLDFIKEERAVLNEQRDWSVQLELRSVKLGSGRLKKSVPLSRAEEREKEREAREHEAERDRLHAKEMLEMKLKLEREKAEIIKESLELQSKIKQEEVQFKTGEGEKKCLKGK